MLIIAKNATNTCTGINQIINVKRKGNKSPSLIVNNKLISDPKEVADKFNKYFSTIAENFKQKYTILELISCSS